MKGGPTPKGSAAIQLDPDDARLPVDHGWRLTLMTDHQCAMPRLETAAQLEPEDPLLWLDRASFYERNELLEWAVYAKHSGSSGRRPERNQGCQGLLDLRGNDIVTNEGGSSMPRLIGMMALVLGCLGTVARTSYGETVMEGTTAGGAAFKIVVPTNWNGDLVIWNHGFSLSQVEQVTELGPLSAVQLSEGYAIAASGYQQFGWALFQTKKDLQNMMKVFKANFHKPKRIFISGASLGGIVTDQAVETAHLGNVVGAYPICGVHGGSVNWNAALDIRLLYDVICANTPGAAIPGGAMGLPAPGFPNYSFGFAELVTAVNACMGVSLPPASRTVQQSANLSQFLSVTKLPENFVLTDMGFALFGLSNLIFDPAKLKGAQAVGNAKVNYDNGGVVDQNIARVTPDSKAAKKLNKNYIATGKVKKTKVVSLHTDKDGLVIVENENFYAALVPPANLTTAIVKEDTPTHCGFNMAETQAGWEALRAWVAGGPQPTAQDIQDTCESLVTNSQATGPCRIDPSFVIPPMTNRIHPR